jgi:hypothetical protein
MRNSLFCLAAIILMAMTGCGSGHAAVGDAPNILDGLTTGAPFIFKGKVVLLHTNTTGERDVSDAGVVTVSEVIDAPAVLSRMSGEQVTVQFRDVHSVKVGEERLFFTDPYWLGESIGVREKGSVGKED